MQMTPASRKWVQSENSPAALQEVSSVSVPVHATLSRKIFPVPAPKKASETAVASVAMKNGMIKVTGTGYLMNNS